MKLSWRKKISVWSAAAALAAASCPIYAAASETTAQESAPSEPAASAPASSESVPSASVSDAAVPETSAQETMPPEAPAPETTASGEGTAAEEETGKEEINEGETSAEGTAEEVTTEEETTEEETTEEETSTEETTEEAEWSEDTAAEDTRGLTFSYSDDANGYVISGFDASRTVVEIPETYGGVKIVGIAPYAFQNQTGITTVVIPEGVTSIGREAFAGCSALGDIRIPSTVENIGAKAFNGTPWDATLTGDVVYINHILYRCQTDAATVEIAQGTRVIAEEAFADRKNLTSIIVPDGVSYISSRAFAGCSSLNSIMVAESVVDIVANAFDGTPWYESRKNEIIYINHLLYRAPETMNGTDDAYEAAVAAGTTTICTLAFANTQVGRVVLPEGLQVIKYGAFQNCVKLPEITLPSTLVSIDGAAFAGCTALSGIVLPEGIKQVGSLAFANCTALSQAVTTQVSAGMFQRCSALTQVQIREGAYVIGSSAFRNCTALINVQLPSTVSTIGFGAFAGCQALTSVQIPAGVAAIRRETFANCMALSQVSLAEGLKYIGEGAFAGCGVLTQLSLPASVLTICERAFENAGLSGALVLPERLRTVKNNAFAGCTDLTSVNVPASVRTMGDNVFTGSTALTISCEFRRTDYLFGKLLGGWSSVWADGITDIRFIPCELNEEQKKIFAEAICRSVPAFMSEDELNDSFWMELIGRMLANGQLEGVEDVNEAWSRVPELAVKRAVYNMMGIMMECRPQNTIGSAAEGEHNHVYYEQGCYYVEKQQYQADASGYLLNWSEDGKSCTGYCYDPDSGIAYGTVTVNLEAFDNDNGLRVVLKTEDLSADSNYNVYESEETKE